MSSDQLAKALQSVDWNNNVAALLADSTALESIAAANMRIAIWSYQFENIDKGNPALSFVREMQIAGQQVAILTALALYKSAAASMRTMVETGLYYSYFRTHLVELESLVRIPKFYMQKSEIIEYHKIHSRRFMETAQALGVIGRLEEWYGKISAIVHGQIPGVWVFHKSVAEIKPLQETKQGVIEAFKEGEEILHRFLLCTAGTQLWDSFSSGAKQQLLKGLSGDMKKSLQLDAS